MTEKNKGSNLILIIGALAIMIVTICAFNKERIAHKYFEYTVDKQYGTILTNEYYLEDNFEYVNNYDKVITIDTLSFSKEKITGKITGKLNLKFYFKKQEI